MSAGETQMELLQHSRELDSAALAAAPEFTTVKSRRRKAQSSKYKVREPPTAAQHVAAILRLREAITKTRFYEVLKENIMQFSASVNTIRCLALGRVSETEISRVQTAILDALRNELRVERVTCYDPDFVELDLQVLRMMNIEIADETQTDEHTFYYMPHAPIFLVDRVMSQTNTRFVLGNDVHGYSERLQQEVSLVYSELRRIIHEIGDDKENTWRRIRIDDRLAKNESWWTSVNDLAMHWR